MRRYTRITFALNAVFQTILGVLCLLAPEVAIRVYGGDPADEGSNMLLVAFRMLGVNILLGGVISAMIGGNPDAYPILRPLMGLLAVLKLVCWGVVVGAHDLTASQVAMVILDGVIEVLLIVAVACYYPRPKTERLYVRSRVAA